MRVIFDDGHSTGIYSWPYLYRLGPRAGVDLAGLSRRAGGARVCRAKVAIPRGWPMTLRLLHTADWQLGKPFQQPAGRRCARSCARRVRGGAHASPSSRHAHEVAAVLVAGDVFDGNLVPERTIVQALAAMRGFAGPWVLLPGNHDAALAEGVWSRLDRLGRPANS